MKAVMYHYVRPEEKNFPRMRYLAFENFKKQLDYFTENFGFIKKEDYISSIKSGAPVKEGVILTFDDGLKDHYSFVFPELKKRNLWGIFYVSTSPYTKDELLDVHKIHLLIGKWGGKKIFEILNSLITESMMTHSNIEDFKVLTYKSFNDDECTNNIKRILNYYLGYEYRGAIMNKLIKGLLPEAEELAHGFYLSKMEIIEMRDAGMIIGSHSHAHTVMSRLKRAEQEKDIAASFKILEDILGKLEPKTFCQPYGGFFSFNSDTEQILEEQGCDFSFNVEPRDIEEKDLRTRKQALPRYDCNCFPFGQCENTPPADALQSRPN